MKTLRVFFYRSMVPSEETGFPWIVETATKKEEKGKITERGECWVWAVCNGPWNNGGEPPIIGASSCKYTITILLELYIKYATLNSWIRILSLLKSFCKMFIWWNKCTFTWYYIFISLNMFASEICDIHFNACKHIYCLDGLVFFRTDNIQKQAFND